MESAATGKGLDEVIHLFQSPMPDNTGLGEVSIGDDFETLADDYDSTGNVGTESEAENVVDDQAKCERDPEEMVDEVALSGQDHEDDEPISEPEGFVDQDDEEAEEAAEVSQHFDEAVVSGVFAPDDDVGDGETSDAGPSGTSPLLAGDEAHDPIGLDFNDDEEIMGNNLAGIEEQFGQDDFADPNATLGATDASTTTTTLKDDGDAALTPEQTVAANAVVDTTLGDFVEQDDLAEIDWRDEPELLLREDETSGAAKRARAEDEIGAEDANSKLSLQFKLD
jgi:hypothetical protein